MTASVQIKQAVILAGGRGSRLGPLTDGIPKPMIPIHGRPFLEYLLVRLKENGIERVVLLLGYLADKVVDYFGDGSSLGLHIDYSVGDLDFETGKRLWGARNLYDDRFLLMYCDNIWPLNLDKLVSFYQQKPTLASVTVYNNWDQSTQNNMFVDEEGYVCCYDKSRTRGDLNGVEIGFFILNKSVLGLLDGFNESFEKAVFPKLIGKRELRGFVTEHKYYSVGKAERLPQTRRYLEDRKSVFLDRDGVINKKAPKGDYVKHWGEFEFLPGSTEAIKKLTDHGYDIYLITNQAGIARGKMTEGALHEIHEKLQQHLRQYQTGIRAIYYCPHGWDEGCRCRKPKPGMLFQAARDHQIDLTKTYFIGDDVRDMEAGRGADVKTILMGNHNLLQIVEGILQTA